MGSCSYSSFVADVLVLEATGGALVCLALDDEMSMPLVYLALNVEIVLMAFPWCSYL